MASTMFRLTVLFAILLTAACSSDDDSQQQPSVTSPDGLIIENDKGASAMAHGLYISSAANDPSCCWISANATVTANKTAAASNIVVTVDIPGFKFFAAHGQTVTVTVDGQSKTFPDLIFGKHSLSAKLDNKMRTFVGPVVVVIRSARPFIPIREGVNGDARHLGVLLKGISFT